MAKMMRFIVDTKIWVVSRNFFIQREVVSVKKNILLVKIIYKCNENESKKYFDI